MTRWLTPAFAFGVAASETTASPIWKSPTRLPLSQSAIGTNNAYNPGNIVLDYMGRCTGNVIDKESCLVSTTLATLMSADIGATDGCSAPDIPEDVLVSIMTDSRAQCLASGQSISDEIFLSTKDIFYSGVTDSTCFAQMCLEFENPSPSFMEIVFDEAVRCANVKLDVDDCIHDSIMSILFDMESSSDDGARALRRSLQEEDGSCSMPSASELYAGATWMLQNAQGQCSTNLSISEFDATVSELVKLFGSPQCFGEQPCTTNSEHDTFSIDDSIDDSIDGVDWIDVSIKYVEQCAGIELDRDDCLVSTVMDMMTSSQGMNSRRFLQEGGPDCAPPEIEEAMMLALVEGSRQQCSANLIEYTEEEYQQRVNQIMGFMNAESCWIDLCEETISPSETFIMLFIEEVAECADAEISIINQCLFDGVFGVFFSSGAENQTDIAGDMSRRALRILSHNETVVSSQCGPSEEEVGPFIGLLLYAIEQNCTASGEQIEQSDLETAYNEMVKLFTAPPQCWGDTSEGCIEGEPKYEDEGDSDGFDYYNIAIEYVTQCADIDLDMDDCFVSTALEIMKSGQPMTRGRFLQEEGSPCSGSAPNFEEDMLLGVFDSARNQCSSRSVQYSTYEYQLKVNQLLEFFGSDSCWVNLCEDSMNQSESFMKIAFEATAECANAQIDIINQCLWDETIDAVLEIANADQNIGPNLLQRKLSHDTMCPSNAEMGWALGELLMKAGQSCIDMGEALSRDEIDTAYTELSKLFTAPPKCTEVLGMGPGCYEGGFEKKSQEEIDSQFVDFVQQSAVTKLLWCSDVQLETCTSRKSLHLLLEMVDSCAPPAIDEVGIVQIVHEANKLCLNEPFVSVGQNDLQQAMNDIAQLVFKPQCWEDVCQHDSFKMELFDSWMNTCSYTHTKYLHSNTGITSTKFGMQLENDKLKCMTDFILSTKGNEESHECGVLKLGPNVCGSNFDLGLEAYVACRGDVVNSEYPTPAPLPGQFSMSYSFEENPLGWEDFEWANGPGVDMEYMPYEMSMSYSFDDVTFDDLWVNSMSYSFDDDDYSDDDYNDDDGEFPYPHDMLAEAYVMEVCHLLEMMQYNLAARDCMEPLCEIGIDDALFSIDEGTPVDPNILSTPAPSIANAGSTSIPSTNAWSTPIPSTMPTMSPSTKPTLKPTTALPTSPPTASPTQAKFGSVDIKFDAAVTLEGINVSDLDFTSLGAVVDLLEKVFESILPEGAMVRLLRVGGISVTRRMLRNLQDDEQGVEVEFEVTITETCEDADCNNSEDISNAVYDNVTSDLKKKVEDGSLSTAIQEEADAEGVSELANVSVKPDSLKASEPTVTVKKAEPETDDDTDDDSSSFKFKSTLAIAIVSASALFLGECF